MVNPAIRDEKRPGDSVRPTPANLLGQSEAHDPGVLLGSLSQIIAEAFGVRDVRIHVLDPPGRLSLVACGGEAAPGGAEALAPGDHRSSDSSVAYRETSLPGASNGAGPLTRLVAGHTPYLWWTGDSERETRPRWARAGQALVWDGGVVGALTLAVHAEEQEFAEAFLPALATYAHRAAAALYRLREQAAAARSAERLAALQQVSQALVSHAELDEFLSEVSDTLLRVTGLDLAAVALLDAGTETLRARVVRGRRPALPEFYDAFPLGERLSGHAARTRSVAIHHHLSADPSPTARVARMAGLETAVCMPLWLRDQLLGVLFLASASPWELASEEIDVVVSVAHQISARVANAALLEQAQRQKEEHRARSEELKILSDVSQAMVATNSLEARLREIACALTRVTGISHCAIFRREPDGLAPWVCHGATEEQSRRFHSLDLPPEEVRRLVRLLQHRKGPFVAAGGARDPFARSEWLREQQIRGALWLPFHLERRIIGVALCYRPGEAPGFSEEQLRLAGLVAAQGAIAIRMSQAFEHERNIATRLQIGMLPTEVGRYGRFELGSAYHPALQEARVGGDFYDVFVLPDQRLAMLMADVSGKGLEAAMQTTMLKNMLRAIAAEDPEPASVLARLNRTLYHFTEPELFVTAFFAVLCPVSGALEYANAGHDCPLLYRAHERFCTALDTTGIALGMDRESRYFRRRLTLEQGDVLLLYTDGITDARQSAEFFGRERLEEMLPRFADARPSRIVRYVYREAVAFSDSGLHDDVALLCVKVKN